MAAARDADVVVVGGGITGVATLRALARAGVDAILFEQFELGHTRGSSHGTSRIFRLSYPELVYSRLALEAWDRWRELEVEVGEQLIVHTGSIDVGDEALAVERTLLELDLPFEVPPPAEAEGRWGLRLEQELRPVFQPSGGYSLADRSHAALTASARAAGGTILEREPVLAIVVDGGGVRVASADREVAAQAVVVSAGAWARELVAPLGIELPVVASRETVAYFSHPDADELPPVIEYPSPVTALPDRQAYYALPAPGRGLKAGVHHAGGLADPGEDGVPDESVVAATSAWIGRRYPGADSRPEAVETCLYTNTADESFVIERHGRLVVASACSGHGFKFAPVHGERAAALARAAA